MSSKRRSIEFVAAAQSPVADAESGGDVKRARAPSREPALARYVRTGRFEILVADPRAIDIFSQSLTFDAATHTNMQEDRARCAAFAEALGAHAAGKVVLDVGTGPSALLAIMAAQAGATRVYAVEADATSADSARRRIRELVDVGTITEGQIVVVEKFSTDLTPDDCPEPVQVVVHELLGTFASSEGVRHFLGAARRCSRVLPSNWLSIPHRAQTMVAPGVAPSLELLSRVDDRHTAIGPQQKYLLVGRSGSLPRELLLSEAQPFEDLHFNARDETVGSDTDRDSSCEQAELRFVASRDATVAGLWVWMRFQAAAGQSWLDSFDGGGGGQSTSWAVLFLPLNQPRCISGGDFLYANCAIEGGDSRAPTYKFRFSLADGEPSPSPAEVTLSLGDLYPLNGGAWCRACAGTTDSVAEERRAWRHCHVCRDAYHRRCIATSDSDVHSSTWTCQTCRARVSPQR